MRPEDRLHLQALSASRPDWRLIGLDERVVDESEGGREHKYTRAHPYITGMLYVMRFVSEHGVAKILDIGSPLVQNVSLAALGVQMTVVDVRPHEDAKELGLDWCIGTATALPFPDSSRDFVTSLWVMGHVGDARYGDALDIDGDRKMIAEIHRVLRPGGVAIVGPGLIDHRCANIFNLHRIYSWYWLRKEFDAAGFDVLEEKNLHVSNDIFLTGDVPPKMIRRDGIYGLAVLRKR